MLEQHQTFDHNQTVPPTSKEYMSLQKEVLVLEIQKPAFISDAKIKLSLDRPPTENELVATWIEENSERFRNDPVFRAKKIALLHKHN